MTETANSLAAQVHGLERLAAVPPEIALMVWKFVEKSPLYRFAAVLNKVDFFDDATGDGIASMPLTRIERWDRGGDLLERTGHEDVNQLITVDSRGIRSIEEFRLSDMRTRKRDEATLYAVHQSRQNINFDTKVSLRPSRCFNKLMTFAYAAGPRSSRGFRKRTACLHRYPV